MRVIKHGDAMTDNPAMTRGELIAALERASGPDRELDAQIYCTAFPGYVVRHDENGMVECYLVETGTIDPPRFTASLDAAITLVPDGWSASVCVIDKSHNIETSVSLCSGEAPYYDSREIDVEAPTAILALCIAALKALTLNGGEK